MCMCGYCNVWVCVYVCMGFVMCGCVYKCGFLMCECMYGFCNVWVCLCVAFVMCVCIACVL